MPNLHILVYSKTISRYNLVIPNCCFLKRSHITHFKTIFADFKLYPLIGNHIYKTTLHTYRLVGKEFGTILTLKHTTHT